MTNDTPLYFNVTVSRESVRVNFRFRFKTRNLYFPVKLSFQKSNYSPRPCEHRSYNEM